MGRRRVTLFHGSEERGDLWATAALLFPCGGRCEVSQKQKALDNNDQKEIFPRPEEEEMVLDSTESLQVHRTDDKQARKYFFSNH